MAKIVQLKTQTKERDEQTNRENRNTERLKLLNSKHKWKKETTETETQID
jgi:hypothetical protein